MKKDEELIHATIWMKPEILGKMKEACHKDHMLGDSIYRECPEQENA